MVGGNPFNHLGDFKEGIRIRVLFFMVCVWYVRKRNSILEGVENLRMEDSYGEGCMEWKKIYVSLCRF